jgi:hypothetical protein
MKTKTTLLACLALLCTGALAHASPQVRDHRRGPPPPPAWDSRGWTMLGEKTVEGRNDRDTITVGRYQGRFDQLTLRVEDSDVELVDFVVRFTNGEVFSPKVGHYFREGTRTRIIELPGNSRTIQRIDLRYRNVTRGARARVQVWGRDTRVRQPPPPTTGKPRSPGWDSRGWVMLGERSVQRRMDRDTIVVGRDNGRFRQLALVVEDGDLELFDMVVHFHKGKPQTMNVPHFFREGSRSRAIDLPGKRSTIKKIELRYRSTRGGDRARVQVWGR